jgi:hypothetical protein|tara:strand:- start:1617 stop:1937 length:321 start_codon:yes stop_codon:yes gene_type:complete
MENEKLINELKAKHGKIYTVTVPLDEDDSEKVAVIYLKKPDKATRSMVTKFATNSAFDKAVEAALKNLYVGGDSLELILKNDDALVACEEVIAEMLTVQKATLKKN